MVSPPILLCLCHQPTSNFAQGRGRVSSSILILRSGSPAPMQPRPALFCCSGEMGGRLSRMLQLVRDGASSPMLLHLGLAHLPAKYGKEQCQVRTVLVLQHSLRWQLNPDTSPWALVVTGVLDINPDTSHISPIDPDIIISCYSGQNNTMVSGGSIGLSDQFSSQHHYGPWTFTRYQDAAQITDI